MSKIAGMGTGHDDNRYGGKPPMVGNSGTAGHPIKHKRAHGGSIPDDEKEEMAELKKRARGGKAPMHVAGAASKHHRLDRRGRKSGGSVGADTSPLTSASRLSAPEKSGSDD